MLPDKIYSSRSKYSDLQQKIETEVCMHAEIEDDLMRLSIGWIK